VILTTYPNWDDPPSTHHPEKTVANKGFFGAFPSKNAINPVYPSGYWDNPVTGSRV